MPNLITELTRRNVIRGAVGLGSLAALSGGSLAQTAAVDESVLQDAAFLLGTSDTDPNQIPELAPDGPFFGGNGWKKERYAYIYQTPSGAQYRITQDLDAWDPLGQTNFKVVNDSSDLPAPTSGTHTLENKVYWFDGFVTSQYGLDISNSPILLGRHGGIDGFIHTGGATAITGTDGSFFARNAYLHAPGGTLLDISANRTSEMFVESCAFSDAAGIANIANLGTITGFRVPTILNSSIEQFDAGLTFDGQSNKIFISETPIRNITASGVQIFSFTSNTSTTIVDVAGIYLKDVQSDTEVFYIPSGSLPSQTFLYRGNTHDNSVTKSNILTGALGLAEPGTIVRGAYPLADTEESITIDSQTSTTITGSGTALTQVNPPTTVYNPHKMSNPSDGVVQYDGKTDVNIEIDCNMAVSGANTDFHIHFVKNGTILERAHGHSSIPNSTTPTSITLGVVDDAVTGDQYWIALENLGGTKDLTVDAFNFHV